MMVVDASGLKLVDWNKMASYIILGVKYFFQFFIIGKSFLKVKIS